MAISSTLTTSFKKELLTATHNFATNGNAFKLALYNRLHKPSNNIIVMNFIKKARIS